MKFTISKTSLLIHTFSALPTALLLILERVFNWNFLSFLFFLNGKFVEEALHTMQAVFWITGTMSLGFLSVVFALTLNKHQRRRCLKYLDKIDLTKMVNHTFYPSSWLNRPEGVWVFLAGLELMTLKLGSALTGTVLGVGIAEFLLGDMNLGLAMCTLLVAYCVAIFPNLIRWRLARILNR